MAQNKRHRVDDDLAQFMLAILYKEGALSLEQLQENTALQRTVFHDHREQGKARIEEKKSVKETCDSLTSRGWICLNKEIKYELTEEGKSQAITFIRAMERGAAIFQNQILSPTATARNTTVGYVLLSAIKLFVGVLSGSVGLVADGSDTAVDTVASALVWVGIKFKREIIGTIIIIALMFLTAAVLLFDSFSSIFQNIRGVFEPMSMPYVVIVVELFAMVVLLVTSLYQRFVGRRSQSLALISQSIDSKNSIYSAGAVIVGAVFSIFGFYWVDAFVGGVIAIRISLDGIDLSKEVRRSMMGFEPEFSKYKLPFEKHIEKRRMDSFRDWVMYAIDEDKISTKQEIIESLEKTFRPVFLPQIFSEFVVGSSFSFQSSFDDIIKPLSDEALLTMSNDAYHLTKKGRAYIKSTVSKIKYKQTEL